MISAALKWVLPLLLLTGCSELVADPTERGLRQIATAIVVAAIIRAFFNK